MCRFRNGHNQLSERAYAQFLCARATGSACLSRAVSLPSIALHRLCVCSTLSHIDLHQVQASSVKLRDLRLITESGKRSEHGNIADHWQERGKRSENELVADHCQRGLRIDA